MEKRQNIILEFIKKHPNTNSGAIIDYVSQQLSDKSSRPTILRDIDTLIAIGKVIKSGSARATTYSAAIDVEEYFATDPDKRTLKNEYFNFDVWGEMHDLFSKKELSELDQVNDTYRKNKAELSPVALK